MSAFSFKAERPPFPRWLGPFSPSRGRYSGFRFHSRQLGTWVAGADEQAFWAVDDTPGVQALTRLVLDQWNGGRILLLTNGMIIKPLQRDQEIGRRVLVGRFQGNVVLRRPNGGRFDLGAARGMAPGAPWPGPGTIGLECVIARDGSLTCIWHHPTPDGQIEVRERLFGPDQGLAAGFRSARPGHAEGRVRITANGLVITNRQSRNGDWSPMYVGRVLPHSMLNRSEWIQREQP